MMITTYWKGILKTIWCTSYAECLVSLGHFAPKWKATRSRKQDHEAFKST